MPLCFFSIIISILSGCAGHLPPHEKIDFSLYHDKPLPIEALKWLESGPQSAVTDRISREASTIPGATRRERLFRGFAYLWGSFKYDAWTNSRMFQLTAEELFNDRALGGCSDYALVQLAFFRALKIPSRLVVTANIDWIEAWRENPLAMIEGHSFIEVYLEDRWQLLDTTFRFLHADYDIGARFYPHREFFCNKGRDFWDLGIRDVEGLARVMDGCTGFYKTGSYAEPDFPKEKI